MIKNSVQVWHSDRPEASDHMTGSVCHVMSDAVQSYSYVSSHDAMPSSGSHAGRGKVTESGGESQKISNVVRQQLKWGLWNSTYRVSVDVMKKKERHGGPYVVLKVPYYRSQIYTEPVSDWLKHQTDHCSITHNPLCFSPVSKVLILCLLLQMKIRSPSPRPSERDLVTKNSMVL